MCESLSQTSLRRLILLLMSVKTQMSYTCQVSSILSKVFLQCACDVTCGIRSCEMSSYLLSVWTLVGRLYLYEEAVPVIYRKMSLYLYKFDACVFLCARQMSANLKGIFEHLAANVKLEKYE